MPDSLMEKQDRLIRILKAAEEFAVLSDWASVDDCLLRAIIQLTEIRDPAIKSSLLAREHRPARP